MLGPSLFLGVSAHTHVHTHRHTHTHVHLHHSALPLMEISTPPAVTWRRTPGSFTLASRVVYACRVWLVHLDACSLKGFGLVGTEEGCSSARDHVTST